MLLLLLLLCPPVLQAPLPLLAVTPHTPAVLLTEGKQPCPRCQSEDTKFCYFNNYNIKQPRYFCRVHDAAFFVGEGAAAAELAAERLLAATMTAG